MPAHAVIELRDVEISTSAAQLVKRLSCDVLPGRVLAFVADHQPTLDALASVLSGNIEHYSVAGDLVLDGRELVSRVGDQTQASLHVARVTGPLDSRARVRELAIIDLERVGLGADILDQRVSACSASDRLRLAFAQALAAHPQVVVLALPHMPNAGSLYSTYSALLHDLAYEDSAPAFIVCTDSLAVAADVADDVVVLLDGHPVEQGSVYDICLRPSMPYVQDLLRVTPSPHKVLADFTSFVDLASHAGCPWVLNCRENVTHACSHQVPELRTVGIGHTAACHLIDGGVHA